MLGGGTGPAEGTNATTCTPGPAYGTECSSCRWTSGEFRVFRRRKRVAARGISRTSDGGCLWTETARRLGLQHRHPLIPASALLKRWMSRLPSTRTLLTSRDSLKILSPLSMAVPFRLPYRGYRRRPCPRHHQGMRQANVRHHPQIQLGHLRLTRSTNTWICLMVCHHLDADPRGRGLC